MVVSRHMSSYLSLSMSHRRAVWQNVLSDWECV